MPMQQYSFQNINLIINGVSIKGYDEGDDVITIRRINDNASHILSADGIMTVSFSPDRSGEIIFRLNQASEANKYLASYVNQQETTGLLIPMSVALTDTTNKDLFEATEGYIPKPADAVRGLNTNAQEWRIVVERLNMAHLALEGFTTLAEDGTIA